jgi:hypothetical protein
MASDGGVAALVYDMIGSDMSKRGVLFGLGMA